MIRKFHNEKKEKNKKFGIQKRLKQVNQSWNNVVWEKNDKNWVSTFLLKINGLKNYCETYKCINLLPNEYRFIFGENIPEEKEHIKNLILSSTKEDSNLGIMLYMQEIKNKKQN
jgi:hypothetical protein